MLEEVAKNLWLLLTLIIPGLFTYGAWRIILLLEPSKHLAPGAFNKIDSSILVTTSIIVAIALVQQAIAMAVEALLALLAKIRKNRWPNFHTLFCERFELDATGKLNEKATRIIGNSFLSMNMCVGIILLLFYFLGYESMEITQWVPISLLVLLIATVMATLYRMIEAERIVKAAEEGKSTVPES